MKIKLLLSCIGFVLINVSIYSQIVNIPDANFKNYLINDSSINTNADNEIQVSEAINFTGGIYCFSLNINDLTGIEAFTNLQELSCSNNNLTSLDVSQNTELQLLQMQYNDIQALDLSQNINLTSFLAFGNDLSYLNIQNGNNTNMTVNISDNSNLACVDVDNVAYAESVWAYDPSTSFSVNCQSLSTYIPDDNFEQFLINQGYDGILDDYVPTANIVNLLNLNISGQNISDLTGLEDFLELRVLDCSGNPLNALDITQNTLLRELYCSFCSITSLNLPQRANSVLEILDCSNNFLTNIVNINQQRFLENLTCNDNNLVAIDFSELINLTDLNCQINNLSALILNENYFLESVICSYNDLNYFNIQNNNNTNITYFDATNNPNLYCLEVDDVNYSTTNWSTGIDPQAAFGVDCYTQIPDNNFEQALIDLGYDSTLNTFVTTSRIENITSLSVTNREISNLTGIESFTALESLNASNNNLTTLDLSQNTNLQGVYLTNNSLTSLDITALNNLEILYCGNNLLVDLDTSQNESLQQLFCNTNALSSLDLTENIDLETLICSVNNITELDVSQNPILNAIYCAENNLSLLNLKNGNNESIANMIATENPNLTCISIDDGFSPPSDGSWQKDAGATYNSSCSLGNEDFIWSDSVTIYPNPTKGFVNLKSKNNIEKIVIYSIEGKKIKTYYNKSTIDLSNLKFGTYFVEIKTSRGQEIKRILKY